MKDIIILAIESSCDETACAIVKNGKEILSNIVSSQISTHTKYGGVVPEVASRIHVENISVVVEEALEKSNITMDDIDAVAYTKGPGLIGCLHIGVQAAKTIAWMYQKPLIPVHHISGHIYANGFVDELEFPLLALVVSGGHTELLYMKEDYDYTVVGSTQDDAIGEAFDKVARVMGLGYPGGVQIDRISKQGSANYKLPVPKTENEFDFSFSGLKSAVLQLVAREKKAGREIIDADLACTFQTTAVDELVRKTLLAVEKYKPKHVVLAGGVAANSYLRKKISEDMKEYSDIKLTIPPLFCCTDNAAMIAASGYIGYIKNIRSDFSDGAKASYDIEN